MDHPRERDTRRGSSSTGRGLLGRGIRLGRVFGVEIHVDWSLLLIFALITINLGYGLFPAWHPEWSPALVWSVALGAAILFFASVLAHELSHALVARRQNIPVNRITLFMFGGVAHLEAEPESPKAEFLMAAVGPLTSIVIGVLATAAGWAVSAQSLALAQQDPQAALAALEPLPSLLLWLGPINILLGVFNLIPGFPLDGGRVARSIFWWATGDIVKATRWASRGGQLFAWILITLGLVDLFTGNVVGGLWLVLLGWFLNMAARASYQQLLVRRALEDVPVSRIMFTRIEAVPPDMSIERFVREYLMASDQQAFPVVEDGAFIGLVRLEDVRRIEQWRWPETPLAMVMTPKEDLFGLQTDDPAERALQVFGSEQVEQLPVLDHGRIAGLVRQRDLLKWISLQGNAAAPA